MEIFNLISLLDTTKQESGGIDAGMVSLIFNFIGAFILVGALLPPFLDARKTKQTYGLSDTFILNFVISNFLMITNSVFNILLNIGDPNGTNGLILFSLFLFINSFSIYLNTYVYKLKKQNMAAAAAKGISEQEYWEKYLANPTAGK